MEFLIKIIDRLRGDRREIVTYAGIRSVLYRMQMPYEEVDNYECLDTASSNVYLHGVGGNGQSFVSGLNSILLNGLLLDNSKPNYCFMTDEISNTIPYAMAGKPEYSNVGLVLGFDISPSDIGGSDGFYYIKQDKLYKYIDVQKKTLKPEVISKLIFVKLDSGSKEALVVDSGLRGFVSIARELLKQFYPD